MLNMHRISSVGVLTTRSLLHSALDFELGRVHGVAHVNRVQTLAVGSSSTDLLVDNVELG